VVTWVRSCAVVLEWVVEVVETTDADRLRLLLLLYLLLMVEFLFRRLALEALENEYFCFAA